MRQTHHTHRVEARAPFSTDGVHSLCVFIKNSFIPSKNGRQQVSLILPHVTAVKWTDVLRAPWPRFHSAEGGRRGQTKNE